LRVIDQTKIIQRQFLADQARAEEKHAIEIKELKEMLQSQEVQARTANRHPWRPNWRVRNRHPSLNISRHGEPEVPSQEDKNCLGEKTQRLVYCIM
jgi:hypothetical protein